MGNSKSKKLIQNSSLEQIEEFAKSGNVDCQIELGLRYSLMWSPDNEDIPQKDPFDKAFYWFNEAATKEDPRGQYYAADYLFHGVGISQDKRRGQSINKQAADKNFCLAVLAGHTRDNLKIESHKLQRAFDKAKKMAEKGNPFAQYRLSICYCFGHICKKDLGEMMKWLTMAAEQGLVVAQHDLGVKYRNGSSGNGVVHTEALKWFRIAAHRGLAASECAVGAMYGGGKGVDKNPDEAFQWYIKAASKKDMTALYNLGLCYSNGRGVEKDSKRAFECFKEAADLGDKEAAYFVGRRFVDGDGIEKNEIQGAVYYQKSIDLHYPWGYYRLAQCYENGVGVQLDWGKAKALYEKAKELRVQPADTCLNLLLKKEEKWKKVRWLVVALHKNLAADNTKDVCYLATLPKDILLEIARLL